MKKRLTTSEDYKRRIDIIVNYIREHLDSPIDLITLAELSAFSPFHFHRITKAYLGEPIGAFIVRTRLETTAKLLYYSDISISEIAYKVGYDTPSSLTKAFVKLYGVSPMKYRKTNNYYIMTQTSPEINVKLSRAKVVELAPKIVLFISATGMYDSNVFQTSFEQMWAEIKRQEAFSAGIEHLSLYYNNPKITDDKNIKYDICIRVA
jgi:AraC family transcriptional regulator